jgi:uncharacterized protein YuzE
MMDYSAEYDILTIHNGFGPDERFETNIEVGDLILDVSTKGRIVGIEIMNATEFLSDFKVSGHMLEHLADATLTATHRRNAVMLGLVLKAEEIEIPAKIAVALN